MLCLLCEYTKHALWQCDNDIVVMYDNVLLRRFWTLNYIVKCLDVWTLSQVAHPLKMKKRKKEMGMGRAKIKKREKEEQREIYICYKYEQMEYGLILAIYGV